MLCDKYFLCRCFIHLIILLLLGIYCTHIEYDDYWFVSSQIISKIKLEDGVNCTDDQGVTYGNGDEWTEQSTCSKKKCFEAVSGKYIIQTLCRTPLESENPDPDNCNFDDARNVTGNFPFCCPVLHCPEREEYTTTPVPACLDRASNFSCTVWKDMDGCNITSDFWNFTYIYCREKCEFC